MKKEHNKVLCQYNLECIFLLAYNNLKLYSDLESWSTKLLAQSNLNIQKQKRELIAYVFLKKGFFNKNMLRFRKSE